MSSWWMLIAAGALEVVWALGLKWSHGLSRPAPAALTLIAMGGSFLLLARATRVLPVGVAYPVWVGIGVVGTTLASALLLREPLPWPAWGFIIMLAVAIVGLKVTTS